ncbi:hypothetical protein HB780_12040 (plasmid) [Rhizobium lusitanum]|jgi:hypothetical protein|uniref:hypothetical protein n=1 Tax=Rhizobium lusitanum TaxID=293958 RepID=UPI00160F5CC8|nr:hypothetical protein [Rhizobium lusitanum]QND46368.1 hypothetical protein HB780_12040 [Rhizobium lusitanum]
MTDIKGSAHPIRRDPATHLFTLGQAVWIRKGPGMAAPKFRSTYRVTGTLPPKGNVLQYRIRNDDEPHERVMMEDQLESVRASSGGAETLMEKTFGHAQGTKPWLS